MIEYISEFGHYLHSMLNLDIMDYVDIPEEHKAFFPQRATPDYQAKRARVLQIFKYWRWLKENGLTPETRFPWIEDSFCAKYLTNCEKCIWNGNCSNSTLHSRKKRTLTICNSLPKEELTKQNRELDLNNGPCSTTAKKNSWRTIKKKIDKKLRKKEKKNLTKMRLQHPGARKPEESGTQQPNQLCKPADPRLLERQQEIATTSRQAQQMDRDEEQREYLVNQNEDARCKEPNSDSDITSSSHTNDEELVSTYQRVHDSASQSSIASVLITPPVSNEPAVNRQISGSPTSQFEEVGEIGMVKDNSSSCERILKTRLTDFWLTDHSYYQNQPHNMECLGIQTPSESEDEEIDVVTYRGAAGQRNTPSNVFQRPEQQTTRNTVDLSPVRRPRGRPPNKQNRKRALSNVQQPINKIPKRTPRKPRTSHSSDEQPEEPEQVQVVAQQPRVLQERQTRPTRRPRIQEPQIVQESQMSQESEFPQIQPDQDRRNLHNDMERRRRIDLRNHFETLKNAVPEIADKERSPKVMILNEATLYCTALTNEVEQREKVIVDLKRSRKQKRLRLRNRRTEYQNIGSTFN